MNAPESEQENAVKRVVGIATLRRLQRLANEENAQQLSNKRWAFRIAIVFAALLLILFVGVVIH